MDADEALRVGLVDAVVEDPLAAAFDYYEQRYAKFSASSLRHATTAARGVP